VTRRKCVIYARISVTKEESVSIERQLESCRRYAEARDWEILGEFVDDGVSASLNRPEDRPGWKAALKLSGYQAMIIWKVDRLARKVLDFLNADRALQAKGAGLVAVEDPVDMTTAQGRAFAVILAVFGEMEAEAIRARVNAARKHLVTQGRWLGGGTPYGYRVIDHPDGGTGKWLEKDPDRIEYLTRAVDRFQSGATANAVAKYLTSIGALLHPHAAMKRKTDSVAWSRQSVAGILRNPILAGMIRRNPGRPKSDKDPDPTAVRRDGDGEPIIYPDLAIISVEEFQAIQARLGTATTPQGMKMVDRARTSPTLSKVAVCDDCNVFMCRGTNQKRPVLYCPKCRQTLSRTIFEPWLIGHLLDICGEYPMGSATIRDHWSLISDIERREILTDHLDVLRIRRGVVGRQFDDNRVILEWRAPAKESVRSSAS